MADHRHKPHCLRLSVRNRKHIYAKRILKPCFFVKQIANALGVGSLFQFQNNPDAFFGRLIGNIRNIRRLFCLHKRADVV